MMFRCLIGAFRFIKPCRLYRFSSNSKYDETFKKYAWKEDMDKQCKYLDLYMDKLNKFIAAYVNDLVQAHGAYSDLKMQYVVEMKKTRSLTTRKVFEEYEKKFVLRNNKDRLPGWSEFVTDKDNYESVLFRKELKKKNMNKEEVPDLATSVWKILSDEIRQERKYGNFVILSQSLFNKNEFDFMCIICKCLCIPKSNIIFTNQAIL